MVSLHRRQGLSIGSLLPLLVLLFFSSSASAASAVLGIDIGTEYLKAALVKPGIPLEIVLTKDSKRKEAGTLAFKPSRSQATDPDAYPERLYGGDAIALAARYPSDVYPNLKSLLGVEVGSEVAQTYSGRYPGLVVEAFPRDGRKDTIAFKSQSFDKAQPAFTVEELLSMELQNIRINAEAAAGKGSVITDAVITFPPFYTSEEKKALELAAELAGLKVLAMVSDGLAVGLNYATSRTFDSVTEGAKPEYHLVYDMGAGSTTATVLRFQGRTIKDVGKRNKTIQEVQVMGTAWDKTLGGDMLNELIVDDMIAQFLETKKIKTMGVLPVHVKKHGKSMARLWKDAERMRQVLSANTQATTSFEGLYYEDINFKYKLTRPDFEKLISEHTHRVSKPLVEAMDSANLKLDDLESVILHGGAVRTPFVQKQLEATAGGSKIRTNVNADEAAVLGAAFKAAGISPSFRVKDIRAVDTAGYAVGMKWSADGKERQQKLFTAQSVIGAEKQVPFKGLKDFSFELAQIRETEIPFSLVSATNLTASVAQLQDKHGCVVANISTKFVIRLSPITGLPEVLSGSVSCELDAVKEGSVIDGVKGLFGFGSKKGEQEPLKDVDEVADDDASLSTATGTSTLSSIPASVSTKSTKAAKSTPTPTTIVIPLAIDTTLLGLNNAPSSSLPRIRTRLTTFDSSDRSRMLRSEALNTLEAFTYRARDYLEDQSFIAASTDKARQELEGKLSAASEWLYGDGVDAKLADFKEKLKELKDVVEPVLKRRTESEKREDAVKGLRDGLDQMKGVLEMVEGSIKKAALDASSFAAELASKATATSSSSSAKEADASATIRPDADDLDDDPYFSTTSTTTATDEEETIPPPPIAPYTDQDLVSLKLSFETATKWLEDKIKLQEKLSPYDDPAILVADIETRTRQLSTEVSELIMRSIRIQQPKAPKKSTKPKAKKPKATKGGKKGKKADESAASGSTESGTTTTTTTKADATGRKDEL